LTAKTRTYGDACGIARALDVLGSRWAMLVIRELLFGPLRFSDLERALPGASTNMLSYRLRELTDSGVITRRRLSPPASSAVYELTDWGREVEPILNDLGSWGLRVSKPDPATLSPTSVLLFLRGGAKVDPKTPDMVFRLVIDERVFAVSLHAGHVKVVSTEPDVPDATLECDPGTVNDLLSGEIDLETAIDTGRATIDGDQSKLRILIASVADEV